MSNKIKDTDVLAFIDAAFEYLDPESLHIFRNEYNNAKFATYPKGDYLCKDRIESDSIEELKQKLAENTPDARKRKELEEAKAKVAELEKELGGES